MSWDSLETIAYIWLGMAVVVHIILFFVTAPFGRHTSKKWGISINNKAGWVLMELPSLTIMVYFLFTGTNSFLSFAWILFVLWIIHYFNRTFIYPVRIKPTHKKMPVIIVINGILFNVINAGLNGYYLAELAPLEKYDANWLSGPGYIAGALLFLAGMIINMKSDTILINLRQPGETGYKIPKGFLFRYVSSPNLLGEIMEWTGFAIMAWNLPAFTFMVWTFANLVPRARNHHDWYLRHFPGYPGERKRIFPGIW